MVDPEENNPVESLKKELSDDDRRKIVRREIEALPEENLAEEMIKRLHFAIQKVEMYGNSHPISIDAIKQGYFFIREVLNRRPTISLSLSKDNKILVDDQDMPDSYFTRRFARDFDQFRIVSLTFYRDLEMRELISLIQYLERRLGQKRNRDDIEKFFSDNKISHIEANKIHYEMVMGDEVDEKGRLFRKERVGTLFADHPELIKEILGSGKDEGEDSLYVLRDTIAQVTDNEMIDLVIQEMHHRIIGEDSSGEDKLINEIIDELERSLSEEEKLKLRERLEDIRREVVFDSGSRTAEIVDDTRKIGKIRMIDEFKEYIGLIVQGKDPGVLNERLIPLLENVFSEANFADVDHIYRMLIDSYTENQNPGLLSTCGPIVDTLYKKCPDNVVKSFVDSRYQEKKVEKVYSPDTLFISAMLLQIITNLLRQERLLPTLQLLKTYDDKRSDETLDEKLHDDANNFFEGFLSGEPLELLVDNVNKYQLEIPAELDSLFQLLDSDEPARTALHKMETSGPEFVIKVARLLKNLQLKSAVVLAREVRDIREIPRDSIGHLPTREMKNRMTGAIIALAIVGGEAGLTFLKLNVNDKDPAIREASLDAISRIGTPEAVNFLVRFLYTHKNWEANLERFLQRMDSFTAIPMLVKYFHVRRDKWIEIIRVVGKIGGEKAKHFLLDTLDTWTFYTASMDKFSSEEFILTILEAVGRFPADEEIIRAIKLFRTEWQSNDLFRSVLGVFGKDTDRISVKMKSLLAAWKDETREK